MIARRIGWVLIAALACAPAAEEPESAAPEEAARPASYEIDPCGLLSPEDIRDVTGTEPGSPQRVEPIRFALDVSPTPSLMIGIGHLQFHAHAAHQVANPTRQRTLKSHMMKRKRTTSSTK